MPTVATRDDPGARLNAMKLRVLACLLALTGVAAFAQQREFKPDKEIVFKQFEKDPLELHVFLPEGWKSSDKRAAAVFFFGGGWVGGTPTQFFPHSRYLASRGMVAISAQYRTRGSHGTMPQQCVADGKSAVRWVRKHAAEVGVDPNRIAAGGGSAGGHVAATTGVIDGLEDKGEDASVRTLAKTILLFCVCILVS